MVMWEKFIKIAQNIFENDTQEYVMFVFRMRRCDSCKSTVCCCHVKKYLHKLMRTRFVFKHFYLTLSNMKIFLEDIPRKYLLGYFFASFTFWVLRDKCKDLALSYCSNNPEAYSEPCQTCNMELQLTAFSC